MALATDFQHTYDQFVSAWIKHENLRHGGSIAELSASRARLDSLRYQVAVMAKTPMI